MRERGCSMLWLALFACTKGGEVDTGAPHDTDVTDTGVADTDTDTEGVACAASSWSWGAVNDVTLADASFLGEDPDDWAGGIVVSPGDMDGDGVDDLVVGAPFRTELASDGGKVYFVVGSHGRVAGQSLAGFPSYVGETEHAELSGTAALGDVDGDGLADVALHQGYQYDQTEGEALVRGKTSGWATSVPVSSADSFVLDDDADGSTGAGSVSRLGDVDGDGLDDWMLSGPVRHSGESQILTADGIAPGDLHLPTASSAWIHGDGDDYARIWSWGDVDGDGATDLLGTTSKSRGTTWLVYGGSPLPYDETLADAASARILTADAVTVLPDVTGDGVDELVVLSPRDGFRLIPGGTRLSGDVDPTTLGVRIGAGEPLWTPVGVGDVDGDGTGDLAVARQDASAGWDQPSEVYVFHGRSTWAATLSLADADVSLARPAWAETGTLRITAHADFDGDGRQDLVLTDEHATVDGAPESGAIWIVRGRSMWPATSMDLEDADATFTAGVGNDEFGTSYWVAVGDWDGDGCADLAASSYVAPSTGVFVFSGQAF